MDSKALFTLSYGVFLLGSKDGGRVNACITNTCMQVSSNPVWLAITVINGNFTCGLIRQSGVFALSVLAESCPFDVIRRFGYQSGRDTDKFAGFPHALDQNGCPVLQKDVCSVFSCKVISSQDLGTHTLFIAEIEDAKSVSDSEPMTYAYYQNHVKPRTSVQAEKKIIGWRCKICGYEYDGAELPADFICPICGHPAEDFEPIYEK